MALRGCRPGCADPGRNRLLKRSIARSDGCAPRLWRWWWAAVGIVLTGDVVLLAAGEDASVWLDIAASTVFIVAMTMIMLSSLNADPLTLFSAAKRAAQPTDWLRARAVVPLIVGTYAAYVGATVWTDYFNVDVIRVLDAELAAEVDQLPLFERETVLREICDPAVAPSYFEQVAQIIPLLLITLGIEFGFFRATLREPAQRAATAATVALMSIGLVWRSIDVAVGWRRVRRDPGGVARVRDLRSLTAGDLHGAGDPGVVAGCHRA